MLAQELSNAGLFIGERLMSSSVSNEDGHFEDLDFFHLHEKLLRFNQSSWQHTDDKPLYVSEDYKKEMRRLIDQRDSKYTQWGFKDPRSVLFLQEWYNELSHPYTLVIYRHYSETTRSLLRRAAGDWLVNPQAAQLAFWQDKTLAYKMWLAYNRRLIKHIQTHPETTLVVSQDAVLNGFPVVQELVMRFGFDLEVNNLSTIDPDKVSVEAEIPPPPNEKLREELDAVWRELQALSQAPATEKPVEEYAVSAVGMGEIAQKIESIAGEISPKDPFAETISFLRSEETSAAEKIRRVRETMSLFASVAQLDMLIDTVNRLIENEREEWELWRLIGDLYRLAKSEKEVQYNDLQLMAFVPSVAPWNYQRIADGYAHFYRFEMAEYFLKKAIKGNPNNPSFYMSKANMEIARCRYEEALAALDDAIDLYDGKNVIGVATAVAKKCEIYHTLDKREMLADTITKLKHLKETTKEVPKWIDKYLLYFEKKEEENLNLKKTWRGKLENRLKEKPFIAELFYTLNSIDDPFMKNDFIFRIYNNLIHSSHKVLPEVDFLVIGAQKSGTTALYNYLKSHPQICVSKQKELHFFDNEKYFKSNKELDYYYQYYHDQFDCDSKHKIKGEVTPIYMYWKYAIERIYNYNKNMKIIILLRNPIERAFSHWNMEKNRGKETMSFHDAIRKEPERCKEALPYQHRVYSYIDRGFYTSQLREVWRFFDKRSVLILRHEDLKYNLKYTLRKISSFLNIAPFPDVEQKEYFSTPYNEQMSKEDRKYLEDIFYEEIRTIEKILEWDCSAWFRVSR